jgi:predicted phosphoribosyltransferase
MFDDRSDAGEQLGRALKKYKGKGVIVLAIPKGGVEVGCQVARYLDADLSTLIARKLPFPDDPEAGFGAIAEDGSTFVFDYALRGLSEAMVREIQAEQIREIRRRVRTLRGGEPLPDIQDRTAILIDDGLAMGSTMRAAIMLCKNRKAKKIVVAVPVAGADVADAMRELVDEVVVLETPPFFRAVAQAYRNWYDVSDGEVIEMLKAWRNGRGPPRKER